MQPTLDDLRNHREAAMEKFGLHDQIGYANVSQTQLSIARFNGGMKVNEHHFIYNPKDDSLIREDVVAWIVATIKSFEREDSNSAKQ